MSVTSVILLSEYITEIEYPRNEFIDVDRGANNILQNIVEPLTLNGYYIINYANNGIIGYCLIRYKDNNIVRVTEMPPQHFYSSLVKNILLGNYEKDLTNNILLYILYYKVKYSSHNPLTNDQITDGVILELSNIIKLLIDKEHNTYKNESRVSELISDLRKLLIRERIHKGIKPKLNLRR